VTIFRVRNIHQIRSQLSLTISIFIVLLCHKIRRRLLQRLRPKCELHQTPAPREDHQQHDGTMTRLELQNSYIVLSSKWCTDRCDKPTFQRFFARNSAIVRERSRNLECRAQNKSFSCCAAADRKQFPSRPNRFCHDPNLRAAVPAGKRTLPQSGPKPCQPLRADLEAADCASPAGPSAPEPGPLRLATRWPEGFELSPTRCRRPRCNLSGKYLCTRPAWDGFLRGLLRCSGGHLSGADLRGSHSRDISLWAETLRGGSFCRSLNGTLAASGTTELEGWPTSAG